MNAKELYEAGRLDEAVAAALADVKRSPTDVAKRCLLAELLCFAGDLERADKQLDAIGLQDPEVVMSINMFRHVLRGEMSRREFFEQGSLPQFIDPPPEHVKLRLEASIRLREGAASEALELLEQADEARPRKSGVVNTQPMDDLRDLDDLIGSIMEVLTTNGKYYWIPIDRIESIEFRPPERLRDLLWRPARMVVRGGPDGEVFLPVLYSGSHAESEDPLRLGRSTDWRSVEGAPVRGIGQRMFLAGDGDLGIMELEEVTLDDATPAPESGV